MPRDKVLATCKPHWIVFVRPSIIALILLIIGVRQSAESGKLEGVTIFTVVVALLVIVYAVLACKMQYITLTTAKIIGHAGVIHSKILTAPLSRVQDVRYENGFFGKIFGYHTITITTAGTGGEEISFPSMANAKKFASRVQTEIEKN